MANEGELVEFENDRVKITRVRFGQHGPSSRRDRLIIYLEDGHVRRSEGARQEEIRHNAGDVVWRAHSEHKVENLGGERHHVLIVELKA